MPAKDADAAEAAFRASHRRLFSERPALLSDLVMVHHPNHLRDEGLTVYRQVQRAGEFIITFPRAYHSGFNAGFNCAESVNFATAAWLPFGRRCIRRVLRNREDRRTEVLCQDELVYNLVRSGDAGRDLTPRDVRR